MSEFTKTRDAARSQLFERSAADRAALVDIIDKSFPHWIVHEAEVRSLVKQIVAHAESMEQAAITLEDSLRQFAGPWFE